MSRIPKFAAFTAGGILLLMLAAAGLVTALVDPNDYKADIVRLARVEHQRTLDIPDRIKLVFYPRPGANLGRVTLSEHGGKGEFAAIDSARISVALLPLLLRQEVVIDRIDVRGMRASVIRFADGSMNTGDLTSGRAGPAPGSAAAPGAGGPKVRMAIDSIRVSNARLLFDDRKSGRTLDVSHLHIDSGAIARGVPGRMALSANVRINRPAISTAVTMSTRFMPDATRRRIAFTDVDAHLDMSFKEARVTLGGQIELDLDRDEFASDFKGRIDDSNVDLKAGLRDGAYQLTLHVDKVDWRRYQDKPAPAAPGDPLAAAPAEAIDLTPLSALRASGGIHIGELTVGGLHASNVRAALRSDAGRMILQPMAAAIYGGSSSGSLALDFTHSASTPQITLVQSLKGIEAGALLKDLVGRAPLEGKGDIAVDVKTAGASIMQMRQALSGSASLRLADGVINGVDIGAMIAGGQAASGLAAPGLSTRFSQLGASFTIADGIAHNADLSGQATLFGVTGAGDIDLAREQVDYTLACTLAATGIALPVRLYGPWDAVAWQVDGKAISGAAVRQQARDKLKSAIRGLLKR